VDTLSKWRFDHWWALLGAAGALFAIAAVPKPFIPGILIGLGMLFFSCGEWLSQCIQLKRVGGMITESYPWNAWHSYCFGLLHDAIGVGLFGAGMYVLFYRTAILGC
jgi:hypothetical protein